MINSHITYLTALELGQEDDPGSIQEAMNLFETLNGFMDSEKQILLLKEKAQQMQDSAEIEAQTAGAPETGQSISNPFTDAKAGDLVKFGRYDQNGNVSDGREAIEWRVLAAEEDRVLAISEYGLDAKAFNDGEEATSWEKCSLRAWLNKDFYQEAFTEDEQEMILLTDVVNDDPYDKSASTVVTEDRLFLLSIEESLEYFGGVGGTYYDEKNKNRICHPTQTAEINGAVPFWGNSKGTCAWWLRSQDNDGDFLLPGVMFGLIDDHGTYCFYACMNTDAAVRPALWIECGSYDEYTKPAEVDYAGYLEAGLDTPVIVETYVQAKQSWWENKANIYTQDEDGAYFIYNLFCSREDYEKLVPGTKIRVTGWKEEWEGEIELADAVFEIIEGENYVAEPVDLTGLLGKNEIADHMNQKVCFKGLTVASAKDMNGKDAAFLYNWDGSGSHDENSDLYFDVSVNGETYTFTVESYLCDNTTDVYKAVENLKAGDVIDVEGFLHWYEGINPHITSINVQ